MIRTLNKGQMTEIDALLAGVRANPADDAPRLIVADWLEEHGQEERAEFVRVQVQLSHWIPDLVERERLQDREWQLLQRHQAEWLGSLVRRHDTICHFIRGTIHVVHRANKRFVPRPWVTSIRSHDTADSCFTPPQLYENDQRFRNGFGIWRCNTFRREGSAWGQHPLHRIILRMKKNVS
jgi:uncharacterized protein (TIGR02996 family)